MSTYYLYRHIRHDLNVPFYIGIGTVRKENESSRFETNLYSRAYSKNGRNDIWNRITRKTKYSVEILCTSNVREDVMSKEIEFVKLYGRIDNKTGTLCNLTDGGEGCTNPSEDSIKRAIEKNFANGMFKKHGERLAALNRKYGNRCKGIEKDEGYHSFREVYVYSNTDGSFMTKFNSRRDALKALNINVCIANYVDKNRAIKGYILYNTHKGDKVETVPNGTLKPVFVINHEDASLFTRYNSIQEASLFLGIPDNSICGYIKDRKVHKGLIYSSELVINVNDFSVIRNISPKGTRTVVCPKCGADKENRMVTYCNACSSNRVKGYYKKKIQCR